MFFSKFLYISDCDILRRVMQRQESGGKKNQIGAVNSQRFLIKEFITNNDEAMKGDRSYHLRTCWRKSVLSFSMQFLSALDTKATYRSSLSLRMYSSYASLIIFNCLRIEKFVNIYKFKINFDTTLKHFVDLITIKTNCMASELFFTNVTSLTTPSKFSSPLRIILFFHSY